MHTKFLSIVLLAFVSADLAGAADQQENHAPDDLTAAALSCMHQTADAYSWSKFRASEDATSWDVNHAVLMKQDNVIEMTRAAEQFRIVYDEHIAGHDFPISTATYDGKTLRAQADHRNGKKSFTVGIGDQKFINDFHFWSVFGMYGFSEHNTLVDHVKLYSSLKGSEIKTVWLQKDHTLLLTLAVPDQHRQERYVVRTDYGYIERLELNIGDTAISEAVTATQIVDGKNVPKVVTRDYKSPTLSETTRYDFTSLHLLDPGTFDTKGLTDLVPEIGTDVVDGVDHVAYHVTASGRAYENLYSPLTGKVTKGPPSTAPAK